MRIRKIYALRKQSPDRQGGVIEASAANLLKVGRIQLYLDLQERFEDECEHHRRNKEISHPPVGTAGPAQTVGIFDADRLNN